MWQSTMVWKIEYWIKRASKTGALLFFNFRCTQFTTLIIERLHNFLSIIRRQIMALVLLVMCVVGKLGMDMVDIQEGRI